jgi:hypothetical protein
VDSEVLSGDKVVSMLEVAKEGVEQQGLEMDPEVSAGDQRLRVAKEGEEQLGGEDDAANLVEKVDGFVDVAEDGSLAITTKRPAVSPTSPTPKEKFRRVRQTGDSSSSESQDDDDESQSLDVCDSSSFMPGPALQLGDGARVIPPSLQNGSSQDN